MRAIILSIGDELVSGLTANTNAAWLGQQLLALGIPVRSHVTVGDDANAIATAIHEACDHLELEGVDPPHAARGEGEDIHGILIITGGLGPTEDDLTRAGLAAALSQELVEDPDAMVQIEQWFKMHKRPMSASNRLQALRPHAATIIENTCGTAPGLRAGFNRTEIYVTPGVPREMKQMWQRSILPAIETLRGATGGPGAITRITKINTFGMGESILGEKIKDLMQRGGANDLTVGTTVHDGIVSVRIYATGAAAEAEAMTARVRREVNSRLGALVFGEGDDPLEQAIDALLKQQKQTIATAESCTGGTLAGMLTNIGGSSAYFLRGWVTYSNAAKSEALGVPMELIAAHGAVSEEVARAMAEGARRNAGADLALATTGIAGPDGGTAEKPVGTVWIALAAPDRTLARRFIFPGDRGQVRQRTCQMALALLRWKLLGVAEPI